MAESIWAIPRAGAGRIRPHELPHDDRFIPDAGARHTTSRPFPSCEGSSPGGCTEVEMRSGLRLGPSHVVAGVEGGRPGSSGVHPRTGAAAGQSPAVPRKSAHPPVGAAGASSGRPEGTGAHPRAGPVRCRTTARQGADRSRGRTGPQMPAGSATPVHPRTRAPHSPRRRLPPPRSGSSRTRGRTQSPALGEVLERVHPRTGGRARLAVAVWPTVRGSSPRAGGATPARQRRLSDPRFIPYAGVLPTVLRARSCQNRLIPARGALLATRAAGNQC